MDEFDLKLFIAIVETKSMSRAAEQLAISQPSVSVRISNLERELETILFYRKRSGAYVTEKGRKFYYYAVNALFSLEAGKKCLLDSVEKQDGEETVKIGIAGSLVPLFVPPMLECLKRTFPGRLYTMMSGETVGLFLHVLSGDLHFAFVNHIHPSASGSSAFAMRDMVSIPLFEAPVVFIGPPSDKPYYSSLSTYLDHFPVILLKRGMPLRELLEHYVFERLRIKPRQIIEVDTSEMIRMMVSRGEGYSFLPVSSLWNQTETSISLIPIKELRLIQRFYCIHSTQLDEQTRTVMEAVTKQIGSAVKAVQNERKTI